MSHNPEHIITEYNREHKGLWSKMGNWQRAWFILGILMSIAFAAYHGVFLQDTGQLDGGFLSPKLMYMAGGSVFGGFVWAGLILISVKGMSKLFVFTFRYFYTVIYHTVRLDFSFLKNTSYWLTTAIVFIIFSGIFALGSGGL